MSETDDKSSQQVHKLHRASHKKDHEGNTLKNKQKCGYRHIDLWVTISQSTVFKFCLNALVLYQPLSNKLKGSVYVCNAQDSEEPVEFTGLPCLHPTKECAPISEI